MTLCMAWGAQFSVLCPPRLPSRTALPPSQAAHCGELPAGLCQAPEQARKRSHVHFHRLFMSVFGLRFTLGSNTKSKAQAYGSGKSPRRPPGGVERHSVDGHLWGKDTWILSLMFYHGNVASSRAG